MRRNCSTLVGGSSGGTSLNCSIEELTRLLAATTEKILFKADEDEDSSVRYIRGPSTVLFPFPRTTSTPNVLLWSTSTVSPTKIQYTSSLPDILIPVLGYGFLLGCLLVAVYFIGLALDVNRISRNPPHPIPTTPRSDFDLVSGPWYIDNGSLTITPRYESRIPQRNQLVSIEINLPSYSDIRCEEDPPPPYHIAIANDEDDKVDC